MAPMDPLRLDCGRCARHFAFGPLLNVCGCGAPLLARYDLAAVAARWRAQGPESAPGLWRYGAFLPEPGPDGPVSLGEGNTPLVEAPRWGARVGLRSLTVKNEGHNPTGSFKDRGMAVAVALARRLGARALGLPSAGNAGAAAAAYGARAGMAVKVFLPETTPPAILAEIEECGATVVKVPGSIRDAGAALAKVREAEGLFDFSTLKEPYRLEGKKTLGLELWEQLGGRLPGAIIYPTGGGTGLIGMWKAFAELREAGLYGGPAPKLISVQAAGCAPIVKAFAEGREESEVWPDPATRAWGLRVPKALGDFLILRAVRETKGVAVAVAERDWELTRQEFAKTEGLRLSPEGAAALAALPQLLATGAIAPEESVLVFNTGAATKY